MRCHPRWMTPTIGLLGDVMLGRGVAERLAGDPPEDVWSPELRELCLACDLVVCNLECCISSRGDQTGRIRGKPFFFRGPPAAVRSLQGIGVAAVGIANNHALDFEEAALLDTIELLGKAGIAVAGAGIDTCAARSGAILEGAGARIGLLAVSDHPAEYAAAVDASGIAYADLARVLPGWLAERLEGLRSECDLVVAFPHWGPNMNPDTTRWQRKTASEMVAAGATLVAGHSAHVFHGVGWANGAPVLFDLGDALDDYAVDRRLRNDLGVLAIWRPGGGESSIELVGLRLHYCHTGLARGSDAEWIAARLAEACQPWGSSVKRLAEHRFLVNPA
jgi:poly-gamma-glutamate capsule biosynthesis protein CapA/YwtB (metallophosphatase superfamily)